MANRPESDDRPPIGVSDPSGAIATPVNDKDASRETLLEQYKLTLEMASEISTKRQAANNFFIGLLSSFGALYSYLHDKLPESQASGASQGILPILGLAWSIVWLFTIRAYRRINKAKWNVIYDLEQDLSSKPFTWEGNIFQAQGSRVEINLLAPLPLPKPNWWCRSWWDSSF